MRAYKWLLAGGQSAFTGFAWPPPEGGRAGAWVEVNGPLSLCRSGVHACRVDQLSHWLGPELWVLELGGQIVELEVVVLSTRARLVEKIPSWTDAAKAAFARACARQAQGMRQPGWGDGHLSDLLVCAEVGDAPAAGYLAAALAGEVAAGGGRYGADYDRGFLSERRRQAQWLVDELGLADDGSVGQKG
jgi:hypothetical protein